MSPLVSRPKTSSPKWAIVSFIASFLAIGIPFWLTPYRDVSLPSSLYGPGLVLLVLAAFFIRFNGSTKFWNVVLVVGSAPASVVIVRVVLETTKDPTSHNLWPFEVVFAVMVGFGAAMIGAIAGNVVAILRK